jgi:CDP-diacylglycerol---glycerol-3-phosphate 3-phosphatidyltransferase
VKPSLARARKSPQGRAAMTSLPNMLTLARIAAVPVIVVLLYAPGLAARIAALVVFIAASLTDLLDGWLARRQGAQSRFGAMLDPIADKVLVAAVLVMLTADGTIAGIHVVAVLFILAREILISGLCEFLAGRDITVPVTFFAKWKTTLQLVAAGVLIGAGLGVGAWVDVTGLALLWLAALITLSTGLDYLRASAVHFRS